VSLERRQQGLIENHSIACDFHMLINTLINSIQTRREDIKGW